MISLLETSNPGVKKRINPTLTANNIKESKDYLIVGMASFANKSL